MRAVAYDSFGGPVDVRSLPDPAPPPHGIVVRVEATGLCRSDWHGWKGHDADITAFPHVPGHELAGTVVAVGADVRRELRAGDRVTVPFVCACGTCPTCARGEQQVCDRQRQPGFTHWGSFAELVALDWADVNAVVLPEAVTFAAAAALGCRVATSYRALMQVGRLRSGETVAVHGCGGVGLAAVMIAAAAGAQVVAVDVTPGALALARSLGAAQTLLGGGGEAVREATGGGADVSLDAFGSEQTAAASILSLRKRGRHVQVGLLPSPPRLPLAAVIGRELEVLGAHGMSARDYPGLLALVTSGRLPVADLVTRTITLDEAPRALTAMDAASPVGVTIIRP